MSILETIPNPSSISKLRQVLKGQGCSDLEPASPKEKTIPDSESNSGSSTPNEVAEDAAAAAKSSKSDFATDSDENSSSTSSSSSSSLTKGEEHDVMDDILGDDILNENNESDEGGLKGNDKNSPESQGKATRTNPETSFPGTVSKPFQRDNSNKAKQKTETEIEDEPESPSHLSRRQKKKYEEAEARRRELFLNDFESFYSFYRYQHRIKGTRILHFIGTSLALFNAIFCIATLRIPQLLLCPVLGYGPAWIGHFFIEGNKPATFKYPWLSLKADMRMYFNILSGRENFETF
uniref:DUF962 domain-containing protein n=1 Tax=Polytomella parva TaxID=51329 RepID=A0A7S0V3J0_9CHLO|mmetsp:Transcript_23597/g.42004  ORF Transcript_23597/g.42004 Transcript_23597/m.42004 type:complete len:293 (+) Transcript_23597:796-1674(+)|eukprot:CAMPEP_0175075232 /NCGR_PEP_ID=MMETSP0052_2-20121109/21854_1 /TAXON_ID=51329 ORGANISM="Polytomella parva, Strain SAG 63-3" /NCGR_SAMPLE_ID=MMETSP0052_2 /ASSEMBLY_ACC=CAM_ASM_000194 /LENGTH=292 /DNA_ID=CAMNT_0016343831 /DNA_START=789 /DNA_END=1667 /DNA_ORIENTATION=+